jgi:hypothetical protein
MKSLSIFLVLLAAGFYSCKKEEGTPAKPAFEIAGVKEAMLQKVVIGPVPELFFTYDFQYVHSEQEVVTLALEDVPAGLWHRFSPGSGEPSFSCKLFMADSAWRPAAIR